jgi:hypothetical protein
MGRIFVDTAEQQLISDAFYGSGGFKDGSYLIQGSNEKVEKYRIRLRLSSYANYMQMVVGGSVYPIVNSVSRSSQNDLLNAFLRDCDGNGTSFADFMRNMAIEMEMFGSVITFVDSLREQPETRLEMSQVRAYPYVVKVTPLFINEYELKSENELIYMRYQCGDLNGVPQYEVYDNGFFFKALYSDDLDGYAPIEEPGKPLTEPLVCCFGGYESPWELPPSSYATIAYRCRSIYNLQSRINLQCDQMTFPILWNGNQPLEKDATFAENNVWNGAPLSNQPMQKPDYIVPPNTMASIREEIEAQKKEIFETCNLNVLSTSADASGASRAYSDILRIEQLKTRSLKMSEIEEAIVQSFCDKVGIDNDYIVEYPNDFASLTLTDQLLNAHSLVDLGVSDFTQKEIRKKMSVSFFPNASIVRKQDILDAEEANSTEQIGSLDDDFEGAEDIEEEGGGSEE